MTSKKTEAAEKKTDLLDDIDIHKLAVNFLDWHERQRQRIGKDIAHSDDERLWGDMNGWCIKQLAQSVLDNEYRKMSYATAMVEQAVAYVLPSPARPEDAMQRQSVTEEVLRSIGLIKT